MSLVFSFLTCLRIMETPSKNLWNENSTIQLDDYALDDEWREVFSEEFEKPYFKQLQQQITNDRKTFSVSTLDMYPPKDQVFSIFELCAPKDIKVVVIGQG